MTRKSACHLCDSNEPSHVHNGDEVILDYFTVGRGEDAMKAAQRWKNRALRAEEEIKKAELSRQAGTEWKAIKKSDNYYPKTVHSYESRDGRLHRRVMDAQRRDAEIDLEEWAEQIGLGRGGEWDSTMILNALIRDAEKVGQKLTLIAAIQEATIHS